MISILHSQSTPKTSVGLRACALDIEDSVTQPRGAQAVQFFFVKLLSTLLGKKKHLSNDC